MSPSCYFIFCLVCVFYSVDGLYCILIPDGQGVRSGKGRVSGRVAAPLMEVGQMLSPEYYLEDVDGIGDLKYVCECVCGLHSLSEKTISLNWPFAHTTHWCAIFFLFQNNFY